MFTVNFNERVWFGLPKATPFTSDLSVLHDAMADIQARGKTAMYDAIAAALEHAAAGPLEDRVLIVVSDGGDNASARVDFKGVLDRAQRSNTVIYAIGVFDDLEQGADRHALERLTAATGGVALFPARLSEVTTMLERIAHDIRHRYMIGYVPENPRTDPGYRTIRIVALDHATRKPLQVRSKAGYFPS
jgi:VWFA-related protein